MHVDKLQHCDQQWIRRLVRGTLLALIGVSFVILMGVMISLVNIAILMNNPDPTFNVITSLLQIFGVSIPWLLVIAGLWMATTPDPCLEHAESRLSARRLARYCPFAIILGTMFDVLVFAWHTPPMQFIAQPTSVLAIMQYASVTMSVVSVIGYLAVLRYFRTLAARISKNNLPTHFNIAFWGIVITAVFLIPTLILTLRTWTVSPDGKAFTMQELTDANKLIGLTGGCFLALFYVFCAWGLVDVIRFHVVLRRIAGRDHDVDDSNTECGEEIRKGNPA